MKQFRRHPFTLVEILIALGICAIGVCSIMVLFPIGASASRDAAMVGYAANAADQVLHFAKDCIMQDESINHDSFTYFTRSKNNPEGWSFSNVNTYKDGDKYGLEVSLDEGEDHWNDLSNSTNEYDQDLVSILQDSETIIKSKSEFKNVYLVKFKTNTYEDFSCLVSLYPRIITSNLVVSPSPEFKIKGAVSLRAEVSWPAQLPYDKRQKTEYALDIFLPCIIE